MLFEHPTFTIEIDDDIVRSFDFDDEPLAVAMADAASPDEYLEELKRRQLNRYHGGDIPACDYWQIMIKEGLIDVGELGKVFLDPNLAIYVYYFFEMIGIQALVEQVDINWDNPADFDELAIKHGFVQGDFSDIVKITYKK